MEETSKKKKKLRKTKKKENRSMRNKMNGGDGLKKETFNALVNEFVGHAHTYENLSVRRLCEDV